jgi:hypothetical protein
MVRRPTAQLKLRLPEPLRKKIEASAKAAERSMNTEIIKRLEDSYRKDDFKWGAKVGVEETVKAVLNELGLVPGTVLTPGGEGQATKGVPSHPGKMFEGGGEPEDKS